MWRILVVEDSPTNMALTLAILESAEHVVLQATNAADGIALARREQPDVILMDIQLPDMDGLAATHILKADPVTRHIPVIALTAFAMKGDRERMIDAGCDGYLSKPIRYKEFLATVEATVRLQGPAHS